MSIHIYLVTLKFVKKNSQCSLLMLSAAIFTIMQKVWPQIRILASSDYIVSDKWQKCDYAMLKLFQSKHIIIFLVS